MQSSVSQRSLLNYIGVGILVLGMALGEFIYWHSLHAGSAADNPSLIESPYDSRVYQQEIERTMGVFGLIMAQCTHAVASLHEPGPLAVAIVIGSILVAGAFFFAASRQPRD